MGGGGGDGVREQKGLHDVRANTGRIFVWLGALGIAISSLVPIAGEGVLQAIRGRQVVAPAAREILPRLLLVVGAAGVFVGALFLSTGRLLHRPAEETADPRVLRVERIGQTTPDRRGSVALVIVLATIFGMEEFHLAGRSLGFDEIQEMENDVRGSWAQTLAPRSWVNHISGSVLARLGRALFGEGERGLRFPSVLLGSVGIGGLGLWVMRETGSTGAALWLMTALGANGLLLDTSMRIRGYSPLMWFGTATVLWSSALVRPRGSEPSRARAALIALGLLSCAILLGLSHLFGLFYLAVFTVLVHGYLWIQGARHATAEIGAGALAIGTALSVLVCLPAFPWLFYFRDLSGTAAASGRVESAVSSLLFGRSGAEIPAFFLLLLSALAGGWLWGRRTGLRLVVLVGIVPLWCLLLAAVLSKPAFFFPRFLLLGLVLAASVLALGLGQLLNRLPENRFAGILTPSLLVVVTLGCQVPGIEDHLSGSSGYREALREIGIMARSRGGRSGAVILPAGSPESQAIVRYYAPRDLLISANLEPSRPGKRRTPGTVFVAAVGEGEALPMPVPDWLSVSRPMFKGVFRASRFESPVRVWEFGAP